ncbi:MAG: heat-inducible transcriptional repressor HrcA [Desulfuromonadales bacterium]|nr:heat-inducible transcriptional repressor HrcA [Desulfuromonadales bacterium]MDT8423151.1 heat-inducible transcriptional repressor HrcA [Desulfuromonadales bacterium]
MSSPLKERHRLILVAIIETYIATAQPVGSKALAARDDIPWSAASVRNVMAELESLGYLRSPHTSAGRVPTESAYRVYVQSLRGVAGLDASARLRMSNSYPHPEHQSVEEKLRAAGRLLSSLTQCAGVVVVPRLETTIFRQINFVPLQGQRILAVFITQSGLLQQKLIELDRPLQRSELEQMSNYLNATLRGLNMQQVKLRIAAEMAAERALYDHLHAQALQLSKTVLHGDGFEQVIIEGTVQMFDQPEFSDADRMKRLLHAFEQKSRLIEMLEKSQESAGVQVVIGEDGDFAGCSLISARYTGRGGPSGTLGVIGPNRIDYLRVIPMVGYTARMLGRALDDKS